VDESAISGPPAELVTQLARLKAEAVAQALTVGEYERVVVVGCDSLLELDGVGYGKPHTAQVALDRWQQLRGRTGTLHTGHHVIVADGGKHRSDNQRAATLVQFADLSDADIEAYVATGEPLAVAGGFTIDGLGGAFVTRIEGDHSNVVGISLPLLRTMLTGLGIRWPDLWATH
jgi:septum formation protein